MIPKTWLEKKFAAAEAAATHTTDGKPFGALADKWEALEADIEPGDEGWSFSSPRESWMALSGRAGFALVRNGEPVRIIVTMLN
jgi:hypothetical protein